LNNTNALLNAGNYLPRLAFMNVAATERLKNIAKALFQPFNNVATN